MSIFGGILIGIGIGIVGTLILTPVVKAGARWLIEHIED